jgi:acetyl esterase/lipase
MGQETTFSDYVHQVVNHTLRDSGGERGSGERERVVLAGASMGGMLVLKAAQAIEESGLKSLAAVVLVCSTIPANCMASAAERGSMESEDENEEESMQGGAFVFPARVRWSNGSFESTKRSLPDADEEVTQTDW